MSATSVGHARIWAWREEMGDVYTGEWAPDGDKDAPMEAEAYLIATPAALAASPEGAKLIREAEARGMERAAAKLHWLWNADGTKGERRVADESAKAIRAEAVAIRAAKGEPE